MDFQEVTPKLWLALETAKTCLSMLTKITRDLTVKKNVLEKPALTFMMATELANMLVRNHKIPFRTSHRIVGAVVKILLEEGKSLKDATPGLIAEVSKPILGSALMVEGQKIHDAIEPSLVVKSHRTRGGPSPEEVKRMTAARKGTMAESKMWISERKSNLTKAHEKLNNNAKVMMNPE
jgi:argininosuccinate lyase